MSQKRRTAADEPFLLVRSVASELAVGARIAEHGHGWHQLVHAADGVLMVWTERGSWVVPSRWAVWVPAGVQHRIRALAHARLRTIYVAPAFADLPEGCTTITVSPLLRELVLRTVAIGMLDQRDAVEHALAVVLLDAIRTAPVPPYGLPEPGSDATRRAVDRLFAGDPGSDTATIARAVGLSARTLERRFLAETGLSFGRWRRRGALLASLERLAGGASVKQAAASAGYATPSAFVAAFKGEFGETPGRYFGAD
jgi:AraC-like DNA-binding protein